MKYSMSIYTSLLFAVLLYPPLIKSMIRDTDKDVSVYERQKWKDDLRYFEKSGLTHINAVLQPHLLCPYNEVHARIPEIGTMKVNGYNPDSRVRSNQIPEVPKSIHKESHRDRFPYLQFEQDIIDVIFSVRSGNTLVQKYLKDCQGKVKSSGFWQSD